MLKHVINTLFKAELFTAAAELKVLVRTPSEVDARARPHVESVKTSFQINLGSEVLPEPVLTIFGQEGGAWEDILTVATPESILL